MSTWQTETYTPSVPTLSVRATPDHLCVRELEQLAGAEAALVTAVMQGDLRSATLHELLDVRGELSEKQDQFRARLLEAASAAGELAARLRAAAAGGAPWSAASLAMAVASLDCSDDDVGDDDPGSERGQTTDPEPTFARIEEAWLAGTAVGPAHEAWHFLESARLLRKANPELRADSTLLRELGIVRNRVGAGFAYCSLSRALKDLHRPSLNSPVLLMRLREDCRRPCPEALPGDNEARRPT